MIKSHAFSLVMTNVFITNVLMTNILMTNVLMTNVFMTNVLMTNVLMSNVLMTNVLMTNILMSYDQRTYLWPSLVTPLVSDNFLPDFGKDHEFEGDHEGSKDKCID